MQPYATQTPGVYFNELNAFPNSIVEVATAIPAFIGYTQTASYKGQDLANKPVRVESLQDFHSFFGDGFPQQFSLTQGAPPVVAPGTTPPPPATPGAVALRFAATGLQYTLQPTHAQASLYYLYNAIRLFYLNGGATCYIISIGGYDSAPAQKSDFETAIAKLEYEQEPTMLLCPDALRLSKDDYSEVMQQMLAHCAKVQSRVALFDLYGGAMTDPLLLDIEPTPIDDFRNAVQDNLNYGIAYFPWVKTTVTSTTDMSFLNLDEASLPILRDALNPKLPSYQNLLDAVTTTAAAAAAAQGAMQTAADQATKDATAAQTAASDDATKNAAIVAAQKAITDAQANVAKAQKDLDAVPTGTDSSKEQAALTAAKAAAADPKLQKAVQDAVLAGVGTAETAAKAQNTAEASAAQALQATNDYNKLSKVAANAQTVLDNATALVQPLLQKADDAAKAAKAAADTIEGVAAVPAKAAVPAQQANGSTPAVPAQPAVPARPAIPSLLAAATAPTATDADRQALALAEQKVITLSAVAEQAYNNVDAAIGKAAGSKTILVPGIPPFAGMVADPVNIFDLAATLQSDQVPGLSDPTALNAKRKSVQNALTTAFPDYLRTVQAMTDFVNTLPVAPAMAGVYTAVDNSRGVWKAPANVGLNAVTMPTLGLNDELQANLNVDAATGKSINAIRFFNGMGTQVWGARTLDGNSDDWRYVNVRRTLIMIEQSVKLATRAYVFEPNNANTWVTVQSMINSFLLNLWKQGALFGAVPAQAYNVSVGLGTTMTTEDVLQGIMRVLVRVALVRPAEFILLTFEQEMPGA